MDDSFDTFVTGGSGFIGRWLLAELTRRGRRVVALVRRAGEREKELRAFVDAHGGDARLLRCVDGDLTRDGLGLDIALEGVRDVYHLGAAFEFGMDPVRARAVNVEGTLRVARWAASRPQLRRLVHLGGYRATRMPAWLCEAQIPLSSHDRARLYREHGAYEASKLESQLEVRALAAREGIPLTIVSPSTVIGDSRTGETIQVTGLGEMIGRMVAGELPALAGSARTNVPVVAVDHVAAMLATAPERDETIGRELCVLDARTPPLPELVRRIGDHLGVAAPTRVLAPALLRALPRSLTGVDPETLTFLSEDDYDTRSAEEHARAVGIEMPDLDTTLRRWATYLTSTRFGACAPSGAATIRDVAGSRTFVVGRPETAQTLFLHGLPWDAESWRDVADLTPGSSARVDLPGLGRSSPARVDDVAWLDALLADRARPIVLVGHSLGAGLALRFAARRPQRVSRLVLVSPAFLQRRAPAMLRCAALTSRALRGMSLERAQRRFLGAGDVHPAVESAHAHLRRPGVASRIARALAGASTLEARAELRRLLEAIAVPVTIVHGDQDPLEVRPACEIVTVAGAGHVLHVTHPEAVSAQLRDDEFASTPLHLT
ncbi:alpha/beta fold hydrolase [Sandaracinus amylolyticus]|uniref:Putative hydrolase n=1 Tax=Sandaracinus amylolyticus TaxID=927083 RepID=A0A0F6W8I6_9BACT|nr:alpha/beta fold hydrolase [Sandaracinus amylolyticus]AKF10033.1 putative hydrolase [Sandaracinus amylolyticus]